jgi:hypothetical protein
LRFALQEFSGFGELLCILAAWAVGLAAMWSEQSGSDRGAADNVAAKGDRPASTAYFD